MKILRAVLAVSFLLCFVFIPSDSSGFASLVHSAEYRSIGIDSVTGSKTPARIKATAEGGVNRVAFDEADRSLRKRALFWLGQSGDRAAIWMFEEILLKKSTQ